jgi:hypothetical protein
MHNHALPQKTAGIFDSGSGVRGPILNVRYPAKNVEVSQG